MMLKKHVTASFEAITLSHADIRSLSLIDTISSTKNLTFNHTEIAKPVAIPELQTAFWARQQSESCS